MNRTPGESYSTNILIGQTQQCTKEIKREATLLGFVGEKTEKKEEWKVENFTNYIFFIEKFM